MLLNKIELPDGTIQLQKCNDTNLPITTLEEIMDITKLCRKTLCDIFANGYVINYKNKNLCTIIKK